MSFIDQQVDFFNIFLVMCSSFPIKIYRTFKGFHNSVVFWVYMVIEYITEQGHHRIWECFPLCFLKLIYLLLESKRVIEDWSKLITRIVKYGQRLTKINWQSFPQYQKIPILNCPHLRHHGQLNLKYKWNQNSRCCISAPKIGTFGVS